MEVQPGKRLGAKGHVNELKQHPWFNNFDWSRLENRTMKSPIKVKIDSNNFDVDFVNDHAIKDIREVNKIRHKLNDL